jgi:ubiquinol-cytochrome c reductase cytochrome c1 subunit
VQAGAGKGDRNERRPVRKNDRLALLFAPLAALASGGSLKLDRAPDRATDPAALQNGAKLFVNNCLNCHGASYVRYNRLKDIGLTEQQIKDNLMFTAEKIGEPMGISMSRKDAKEFFGAWPPDLSLIARARASGRRQRRRLAVHLPARLLPRRIAADRLEQRRLPSVGMPHVLWELQGEQVMGADHKLTLAKPGKLSPKEYDDAVGDLVAFMVWMAEPQAQFRKQLGVAVLLFLACSSSWPTP